MKKNWKQLALIGGSSAMLAFGLAGCGSDETDTNETPEQQHNNHSDVNEEMDENNDTGTNQEEQIEVDPNDENK